MRWAGHVARTERRKLNAEFLLGKTKVTQLGKPRRKWKHNMKVNLKVIVWEGARPGLVPSRWGNVWVLVNVLLKFCECVLQNARC
jgi:hypothetical protein